LQKVLPEIASKRQIIECLSRSNLIDEGLGLDSSGKEKSILIDPAQNDRSIRLKMTVAGRLKCTT
jgi:hypothetical protein